MTIFGVFTGIKYKHIIAIPRYTKRGNGMGNGDILICKCGSFILEYRLCGNIIYVTKLNADGNTESEVVFAPYSGEKLRKLCGLLWAARATPCTAKELAAEIEV